MDKSSWNLAYFLVIVHLLMPIVTSQEEDNKYSIPYVTIDDCASEEFRDQHEFFDLSSMECVECTQNSTYQTMASDGLSCECQEAYHRVQVLSATQVSWTCEPCDDDMVASRDQWECVSCETDPIPVPDDALCPDCEEDDVITVERNATGHFLEGGVVGDPSRVCEDCVNGTTPGEEGLSCRRCNQELSVNNDCFCPEEQLAGGLCFNEAADIVPTFQLDFTIVYHGEMEVDSEFLRLLLQAAHGACVDHTQKTTIEWEGYSNLTACQLLGNMCVMTLYDTTDGGNIYGPCSLHLGLMDGSQGPPSSVYPPHGAGQHPGVLNWRANMPWLYYSDDTENILDDNSIATEFSPNDLINFTVAKYTEDGDYVGLFPTHSGEIQLCKDDDRNMDGAYEFGIHYFKKCSVAVEDLFDSPLYETYFYDMYLEDDISSKQQFYPIPVLVANYKSAQGRNDNTGSDRAYWQLTRRFFLVERVAGKSVSDTQLQFVRYAEKMKITIELQKSSGDGKIRPPLLEVTYADASREDYENKRKKEVSFEVVYTMPLNRHNQDLAIAMGVMSALALVYAAYVTMNANRRDGKLAIDFVTIFKFIFYLSGALANVFFVVIFGFTLWWFIMYKEQSSMFLVPDSDAIYHVEAYIGSAFALKALQIIFIVGTQVTADIFFVDWERPAKDALSGALATAVPSAYHRQQMAQQADGSMLRDKMKNQQPVSIWRTYFVANEWNELQTVRRINPMILLLLVVLVLYVIGVEHWGRFDPSVSITDSMFEPRGEYTKIFRFPVMVSMYLAVALTMWLFHLLIWKRCWEDVILNFVDFCAMSNISVFVLTHNQFGYYIHGRSPHGKADVDLLQMHSNLKREETDLCSERGLLAWSDLQTFEVLIPRKFRSEYNKILHAVTMRRVEAGHAGVTTVTTELDEETKTKLVAYKILNRFVQAFIDHNIRGMEYTVLDRSFMERILDTEFIRDEEDIGHFFTDNNTAFTKSIFYGMEFDLQLFTILLFAVMDFACQDFVLAAVITYIIDAIMVYTRQVLGSWNITRKTMVDSRFLI